jgi:dynein heavy chain
MGIFCCGVCVCVCDMVQVLSVIAQQILTMQRAKAAGVKTFEFESTRLTIR